MRIGMLFKVENFNHGSKFGQPNASNNGWSEQYHAAWYDEVQNAGRAENAPVEPLLTFKLHSYSNNEHHEPGRLVEFMVWNAKKFNIPLYGLCISPITLTDCIPKVLKLMNWMTGESAMPQTLEDALNASGFVADSHGALEVVE